MTDEKVPQWVTSWPEWFGIEGNVTVVPLSDYEVKERELATEVREKLLWCQAAHDLKKELAATEAECAAQPDELAREAEEKKVAEIVRLEGEVKAAQDKLTAILNS